MIIFYIIPGEYINNVEHRKVCLHHARMLHMYSERVTDPCYWPQRAVSIEYKLIWGKKAACCVGNRHGVEQGESLMNTHAASPATKTTRETQNINV